jgi:hypothetical protein
MPPSQPSLKAISGRSLSETWRQALKTVFTSFDRSLPERREITLLATRIEEPLSERHPPTELLEDNDFKKRELALEIDALVNPEHPLGQRLWLWETPSGPLNQVSDLVNLLKRDSSSQRALLVSVAPDKDFGENRQSTAYDFPPIITLDFKAHERLSLIAYLRLCDVYLWWPVNALQCAKLMENIAAQIGGIEVGMLNMVLGFAHIRAEKFEAVKKIIGPTS